MAAYTVYLDEVFLGNLLMNYAILWAASKLSRTPARKYRITAGALLGAVYSFALFIPEKDFLLSAWFKAFFSVIMVAAVFAPLPAGKFLACLGCFYLASFALGGFIFGMIFFIDSRRLTRYNGIERIISEHFWTGIVVGLIAFLAAGKGIISLIKSGFLEKVFTMSLQIVYGDKQVKVNAFLDTGNHLKDPLTRNPVIVVEYETMKSFLPPEIWPFYEKEGEHDVWQILSALGENHAARFYAVPFQSLGSNGLLVGFRPDEVVLERGGKQERVSRVVIAIYPKRIDPNASYHALLNPDLLDLAG